MSLQTLIINTDVSADGFKSICDLSPGQLPAAENFINYMTGLTGGNYMALLSFQVGAIQATATITSTGTAANGEEGTLLNVALKAVTSGADPTDGEFNISATPATQATSIALAINSTPAMSALVTAVANLGVVTITSKIPGVIGNALEIGIGDLANMSVGAWANGVDGTPYVLDLR